MCKVFDAIVPQTTYRRLDARYCGGMRKIETAESVAEFFNEYYKISAYYLNNVTGTNSEPYVPEIYVSFDTKGANLLIPEASRNYKMYDRIKEQNSDMPAYPDEGYIKETDELIIVKIYEK